MRCSLFKQSFSKFKLRWYNAKNKIFKKPKMETLFSALNLHPSGFDIAGVRFCCDLHICWTFRFSFSTYAFLFSMECLPCWVKIEWWWSLNRCRKREEIEWWWSLNRCRKREEIEWRWSLNTSRKGRRIVRGCCG